MTARADNLSRHRVDMGRAILSSYWVQPGYYKWFTEGFDTADLKDAKALLDELSK